MLTTERLIRREPARSAESAPAPHSQNMPAKSSNRLLGAALAVGVCGFLLIFYVLTGARPKEDAADRLSRATGQPSTSGVSSHDESAQERTTRDSGGDRVAESQKPPTGMGTIEIVDLYGGHGVADVRCTLHELASDLRHEERTDAAGAFVIPAGDYQIQALGIEQSIRPAEFRVVPGATVGLTLFRAEGLHILVVDALDQSPIAGAQVLVEPPTEFEDHLATTYDYQYRRVATARDGVALFKGVPGLLAGRVGVLASGYEPTRLQICKDSPELQNGEMLVALRRLTEEPALRLRFVNQSHDPRPEVLVRANLHLKGRLWTGPDLAFVGVSDAGGELELRGAYREASQFFCSSSGWPVNVNGGQARDAGERITVVIPDSVPGALHLIGTRVAGIETSITVSGESALDGESLPFCCDALSMHARSDANGTIRARMPRATESIVVVTLSDGRRATLRSAQIEKPDWKLDVPFEDLGNAPVLVVVSLDEPIASLSASSTEIGGTYECKAPAGGALRIELPLSKSNGNFVAHSITGKIVAVRFRGDRAARPAREELQIHFMAGVEKSFQVLAPDGRPLRQHLLVLHPVTANGDFAQSQFREAIDATRRWMLRAGNNFSGETDSSGVLRLELPTGAYEVMVAAPSWRSPLRSSLTLVPAGSGTIYVQSDDETVRIVAEPLRVVVLDVHALRKTKKLGERWFIREANADGDGMCCEGDIAELTVPSSGLELRIADESGEEVATISVPMGTEPWHSSPGE